MGGIEETERTGWTSFCWRVCVCVCVVCVCVCVCVCIRSLSLFSYVCFTLCSRCLNLTPEGLCKSDPVMFPRMVPIDHPNRDPVPPSMEGGSTWTPVPYQWTEVTHQARMRNITCSRSGTTTQTLTTTRKHTQTHTQTHIMQEREGHEDEDEYPPLSEDKDAWDAHKHDEVRDCRGLEVGVLGVEGLRDGRHRGNGEDRVDELLLACVSQCSCFS